MERDELVQLRQRIEELRRDFRIIAHDLHAALQTIIKHARRLKSLLSDDGGAQRYAQTIIACAENLELLRESLARYSNVSSKPAKEWLDPEPWLEAALQNLGSLREDNQAVITHCEMPNVFADGVQLLALLQNLVGNALKYRSVEAPRIHVTIERDHRESFVSVADNGQGLEAHYLERIFQPFFRLNHSIPGSGVGLAICRAIVESHGGRIWCESTLGQGTTFHFTLPHN